MKTYAGIGSRGTYPEICEVMEATARFMRSDGYILRSGHAQGADQAFERGAEGLAEIYLPWAGFEAETPVQGACYNEPTFDAYELAEKHHPGWWYLSRASKALMARNCHQVLGLNLDAPVEFVICFTPNGSKDGHERNTGGTGQALRIAAHWGIPVFNLFNHDALEVAKVAAGYGG